MSSFRHIKNKKSYPIIRDNKNNFFLSKTTQPLKKINTMVLGVTKNKIIDTSKGPIVLFTNARDEKNIKEWAIHHLLLGFDYICIFDHKSKIPIKNIFFGHDRRIKIERCEILLLFTAISNLSFSITAKCATQSTFVFKANFMQFAGSKPHDENGFKVNK